MPFRLPAPTGLIVTGMTATTVSLQWAASPGRRALSGTSNPYSDGLGYCSRHPAGEQPERDGDGLAPNTTYYFHVMPWMRRGTLALNRTLSRHGPPHKHKAVASAHHAP